MSKPTFGFIAPLIFFVPQAYADPPSERKATDSGFDSPATVFAAFQKAKIERHGKTAAQCVTPQYRDEQLVDAWGHQYHFQDQPRTLAKFIDEKKRLRLTREQLPILGYELAPLLLQCIEDKQGAFAAVIAGGPSERERFWSPGKLGDVKIDGAHAQGVIRGKYTHETTTRNGGKVTKESREEDYEYPVYFSKNSSGWRVDLEPLLEEKPEPREKPELKERIPKQPKTWSGKKPSRYAKPGEVFTAYRKAWNENDPEAAWHCLTEQRQNDFLFGSVLMLVESGGGDEIMGWYMDLTPFAKEKEQEAEIAARSSGKREGDRPITERDRFESQQKRAQENAKMFYDRQVFFSAALKSMNFQNERLKERGRYKEDGPLRDVVVTGNRARGQVKKYFYVGATVLNGDDKGKKLLDERNSYDESYYFKKTERGWLIDVPTFDENKRDLEENEE